MQSTQTLDLNNLSWKKFLVLGISAMALSLSLFMSILAPLPIALVLVFYGRMKGLGLILFGIIAFTALGLKLAPDYSAVAIFSFTSFIGVIISEIAKKEQRPSYLIVRAGLIILLVIMGVIGFWTFSQPLPILEFLETTIVAPQAQMILKQIDLVAGVNNPARQEIISVLSNPTFLTKELFVNFPFTVFLFTMTTLWLNSYLLLKGKRLVLGMKDLLFTEYELFNYKVADSFLFILIALLAMALFGKDLGWEMSQLIGMMGLKCLAVLYFFHGFGALIQLLSFWRIRGFFRILIVTSFLLLGSWIVAVFGLLDTWFDFRRKVILKSQE